MGASPVEDSAEKIHEAEIKFQEGRAALRQDDYDKAIELLGGALELRVAVYGELAAECASAYFKYGTALFYKAQAETDAFGGPAEAANGRAASKANGKAAEDAAEDEEDGEEGEGAEGGDEELEDEEEGDLELAWKLLETAKLIHDRQPGHSVEEADIIATLADISLEKEDFVTSLQDYTKALTILEELLQPDDRMLAELCFKISLAHQLAQQPADALSFCRRAIAVCEARLTRLRESVNKSRGTEANGDVKGKRKLEEVENGARQEAQATRMAFQQDAKGEAGEQGVEPFAEQECSAQQTAGVEERRDGGMANGGGAMGEHVTADAAGREGKEMEEITVLLADLREKEEDLLLHAAAPSLEEALRAEHPEAFQSVRAIFSMAAGSGATAAPAANGGATAGAGLSSGSGSGSGVASSPAQQTGIGGGTDGQVAAAKTATMSTVTTASSGFDAPQLGGGGGGGGAAVTNLGVVGRGVKRAATVPLGGTGAAGEGPPAQQEPKRRTLDDMMKGGISNGETSIGF